MLTQFGSQHRIILVKNLLLQATLNKNPHYISVLKYMSEKYITRRKVSYVEKDIRNGRNKWLTCLPGSSNLRSFSNASM
jgi:hypothetical protein